MAANEVAYLLIHPLKVAIRPTLSSAPKSVSMCAAHAASCDAHSHKRQPPPVQQGSSTGSSTASAPESVGRQGPYEENVASARPKGREGAPPGPPRWHTLTEKPLRRLS